MSGDFHVAVASCLLAIGTTASLFGQWRQMLWVGVIQAALIATNMAYNRHLLERLGPQADAVRLFTTAACSAVMGHIAHWPLVVWMGLPIIGIVTDPSMGRLGVAFFATMIGAYDIVGILDGTPLAYPIEFTALAIIAALVVRERSAALRRMLADTDKQNDELTRAHLRLKSAIDARDRMELELRQAQKLEAVGRLAAGVAHEINTPVQFVSDSVLFVKRSLDEMIPLIRRYRELTKRVGSMATFRDLVKPIGDAEDAADLDYVLENVPPALTRTLDGLQRITTIVKSLKEFAHPDSNAMAPLDLNRAIESTLAIAKHEYKLVADLVLDLAEVPAVTCHAGEINQVVLNIVVNAAHAIEDIVKDRGGRGVIAISTVAQKYGGEDGVLITIRDTGGGIPVSVRERVFDPFFTTKEVGRGTGQGLAIAKTVIDKHGGKLSFASDVGQGTTFSIQLPVIPPPPPQSGAYCVVPSDRPLQSPSTPKPVIDDTDERAA